MVKKIVEKENREPLAYLHLIKKGGWDMAKNGHVGKPKRCDAIPGSGACKKTRKNAGMYCRNCTAVDTVVGKRR